MIGTKSRGYSNLGWLSEGEYSVPFFGTHPSPSIYSHKCFSITNQDRRFSVA